MTKKKDTRTALVKLRVTPAEKEIITAKADAQGQTVTDFIRQRALDYRLRQTPLEKDRVRQLARIGVNLNQLALWVNIHKGRAEVIDVLVALVSLERELKGTDTTLLSTQLWPKKSNRRIFHFGKYGDFVGALGAQDGT